MGASSCIATTLLTEAKELRTRCSVVEPDDLALRVIRPQSRPVRRPVVGEVSGRFTRDTRPLAVLDGVGSIIERDDGLLAFRRHIDGGVGVLRASERRLSGPGCAAIGGDGDLLVVC